jgi:hypothetical protein
MQRNYTTFPTSHNEELERVSAYKSLPATHMQGPSPAELHHPPDETMSVISSDRLKSTVAHVTR